MITHVDLPLALWLVEPNKRYHYAGGQSGPYGDTMDAVRLEDRAPEGEALLTEKPSEAALVVAALDNCAQYPTIIDWANLPETLTVQASAEIVAQAVPVAIMIAGRQGACSVILREGGEIDSHTVIDLDGFDFVAEAPGVYRIHVFDRVALVHGSVQIEVL